MPSVLTPGTLNVSIFAVPLTNKSLHSSPDPPKSYKSSWFGVKLPLTLPDNSKWAIEAVTTPDNESIFAVPSMYKSFHCFADEPKSNVSSASGIKLPLTESILAESIFAVPSMYKSFHWFVDEPKSNVSSATGIILELTLSIDADPMATAD